MIGFLCFLYTMDLSASSKDNRWKLIKEENGIKIYALDSPQTTTQAAPLTAPVTDIVKAKAIVTINAPLNKVRAILDDIDHRHEWIPYLESSKALTNYNSNDNKNKRIEYSHFHAPWPASDRDFVYEIELITSSDKQLMYIMKSVASELMPINKQIIRADLFETIYTLTAINNETTKVELIFHADPKGWIPDWIVNIIQRVLPYKILVKLGERLKV